jgi:hypothetical protein
MCILHIGTAPSRVSEGFVLKKFSNKDFWFNPRSCTKNRLDTELVRSPYQHAHIMTEHLSQYLIYLPTSLFDLTASPDMTFTIENTDSALDQGSPSPPRYTRPVTHYNRNLAYLCGFRLGGCSGLWYWVAMLQGLANAEYRPRVLAYCPQAT